MTVAAGLRACLVVLLAAAGALAVPGEASPAGMAAGTGAGMGAGMGAGAAAPAAPAAPASASARRRAELQPGSAITFQARDPLHAFGGRAPIARLELTLNPSKPATASGFVTVHTSAITTGNVIRDLNARRGVFQSGRYPTARYTIESVQAHPSSLSPGAGSRVAVTGALTMHGVTRDVTATGTLRRRNDLLDVRLAFDVRLSDFHMHRPRFFTLVVNDDVKVHVKLVLKLAPAGGRGSRGAAGG